MKTVIAYTDSGYWGKGQTINEALKNANYKRSNKVNIYVANCKQEDLGSDLSYPTGTVLMQITNGFEKLK